MITIDNQQVMIEHYKDILHVTSTEIKLLMSDKTLVIQGDELKVLALSKYEVLVKGKLKGVVFQYE